MSETGEVLSQRRLEGGNQVNVNGKVLTQQHATALPSLRPLTQTATPHLFVLEHLQNAFHHIDDKVKHLLFSFQAYPHPTPDSMLQPALSWCSGGRLEASTEEKLFQWFEKLNTLTQSGVDIGAVETRGCQSLPPTNNPATSSSSGVDWAFFSDRWALIHMNRDEPPLARNVSLVEAALLSSLRILAEAVQLIQGAAELLEGLGQEQKNMPSDKVSRTPSVLAPAVPTTANSIAPRRKHSGIGASLTPGGEGRVQRLPSTLQVPVVGVKELLRYKSLRSTPHPTLEAESSPLTRNGRLSRCPTINQASDQTPLGRNSPCTVVSEEERQPSVLHREESCEELQHDEVPQALPLLQPPGVSPFQPLGAGKDSALDTAEVSWTGIGAPFSEEGPARMNPRHRTGSANVSGHSLRISGALVKNQSAVSSISEDQYPLAPLEVTQLHGTVVVDESGSAVLCQFEIMAELGKGNYGKVSLVMDADGELFALKTLRERKFLVKRGDSPRVAKNGSSSRRNKVARSKHSEVAASAGAGMGTGRDSPPITPPGQFLGDSPTSERELLPALSVQSSTDSSNNDFSTQVEVNPIEQEIAVMKRLNHPNVVKLHAVIEDPEEGQTHLVMQYVDNGPIGKVAPDNTCQPLPFTLALKYMAQVARGLEYLHSQNIIHRDIKPENILIGSDDTAYISDFGVSSIVADGDRPSGIMGTMSFFSPELLASHSALEQYGKESDVWAFGVTLYCLLFGHLPFTGKNGPELMRAILVDTIVIPDHFPPIPDIPTENGELGDIYPFLFRHREEVQKAATALPVPQVIKDLLLGLLHREPSSRVTLRSFRSAAVVRKPERALRRLTHAQPPPPLPTVEAPNESRLKSVPPNTSVTETSLVILPLAELSHNDAVDKSALNEQQQGHGNDEHVHPQNQAATAIPESAWIPNRGFGSMSSTSSSSESSCSTFSSFALTWHQQGTETDITDEERANAVIQCNVVVQGGTRRFSTVPTMHPTTSTVEEKRALCRQTSTYLPSQ